jgi:glycosyltransferase involved in cell wall biosynthesis
MKSLKITFLMTQSLDSPTGVGRISPLARQLARSGHEVEIYALHPNFSSLQSTDFNYENIHVSYVAPMHVMKGRNTKSYYRTDQLILNVILSTVQLTRAALTTDAEIIHICKPHPMNSVAGLAARVFKKKTVFVDCDDYEAGSGNFSHTWQKWMVIFFEKYVPRSVHAVTTNTHFMRELLISWHIHPERIHYLPNGVEPTRFAQPNNEDILSLKERLGLQGKKVVIYVGSLSLASHPVDLLLEAFAKVKREVNNSVLIIVGGGENYELLQKQAHALDLSKDVIFCGRIDPENVVQYYYLGNVSVDPVYDNDAARGRAPLKMFESWVCKVPFVTANVGDRHLLMGSPPAGLIAQAGDVTSLANRIIQILLDENLAEDLRRRGLEYVQQYTWDRLAHQLEEVYQRYV